MDTVLNNEDLILNIFKYNDIDTCIKVLKCNKFFNKCNKEFIKNIISTLENTIYKFYTKPTVQSLNITPSNCAHIFSDIFKYKHILIKNKSKYDCGDGKNEEKYEILRTFIMCLTSEDQYFNRLSPKSSIIASCMMFLYH